MTRKGQAREGRGAGRGGGRGAGRGGGRAGRREGREFKGARLCARYLSAAESTPNTRIPPPALALGRHT